MKIILFYLKKHVDIVCIKIKLSFSFDMFKIK